MNISLYDVHTSLEEVHIGAKVFKAIDEIAESMGPSLYDYFISIKDSDGFKGLEKEIHVRLSQLLAPSWENYFSVDRYFVTALASLSWLKFYSKDRSLSDFSNEIIQAEINGAKIIRHSFSDEIYGYSPLLYISNWYNNIYFYDGSGISTSRSKMFCQLLIEVYKENKDLFYTILDKITKQSAENEDAADETSFIRNYVEGFLTVDSFPVILFLTREIKASIVRCFGRFEDVPYHNFMFYRWVKVASMTANDFVSEFSYQSAEKIFDYCKFKIFYQGRFSEYLNRVDTEELKPLNASLDEIGLSITHGKTKFNLISLDEYSKASEITQQIISLSYLTHHYDDPFEARRELPLEKFKDSLVKISKEYFNAIGQDIDSKSSEDLVATFS